MKTFFWLLIVTYVLTGCFLFETPTPESSNSSNSGVTEEKGEESQEPPKSVQASSSNDETPSAPKEETGAVVQTSQSPPETTQAPVDNSSTSSQIQIADLSGAIGGGSIVATIIEEPENGQEDERFILRKGTWLKYSTGSTYLPFRRGPLDESLVKEIMGLRDKLFDVFGGFTGRIEDNQVIIQSKDAHEGKPIFSWTISDISQPAVSISEVARNKAEDRSYNFMALTVFENNNRGSRKYFEVSLGDLYRPFIIHRPGVNVQSIILGNEDELYEEISRNLLENKAPEQEDAPFLGNKDKERTLRILPLVRLNFNVGGEIEQSEGGDPDLKFRGPGLWIAGRFKEKGIIAGVLETGLPNSSSLSPGTKVQYDLLKGELATAHHKIPIKPTLIEVEYQVLRLGDDAFQIELILDLARFIGQKNFKAHFSENRSQTINEQSLAFSIDDIDLDANPLILGRKNLLEDERRGYLNILPTDLSSALIEFEAQP